MLSMEAASELKYAAAVLVLLAGIGGGALARRLTDWESSGLVSRLSNTFAGGVFLGAALLHMLPDAREKLSSLFGADYPHFALIAGGGFLVILLIDKVVSPAHIGGAPESKSGGISYPYILALTLSVHSIITGIALGLEQHLIGAFAILIAILGHKSTAAMALSISVIRQNIDRARSRVLLWSFYVTTPIGIVIGAWWSGILEGRDATLMEGIFDAMASGTFLYIAVVDILIDEFRSTHLGWLFLSTLLGFSIMALVAVWT
jgi:zinc transporter 1/2/3